MKKRTIIKLCVAGLLLGQGSVRGAGNWNKWVFYHACSFMCGLCARGVWDDGRVVTSGLKVGALVVGADFLIASVDYGHPTVIGRMRSAAEHAATELGRPKLMAICIIDGVSRMGVYTLGTYLRSKCGNSRIAQFMQQHDHALAVPLGMTGIFLSVLLHRVN